MYTIEIEMIGAMNVGWRLSRIILSAEHASITMMNGHTMESNCEFINDDDDCYYYYYTRFVARTHQVSKCHLPFTIYIECGEKKETQK